MGKNYKEYNKLVRDRIPEIIERDDKKCKIEIVSKKEKYKFLEMKLQEEVNEFIEDKNLEELADAKETKQEGEDIYEVKKKPWKH